MDHLSATVALDAYLARQISSESTSSSAHERTGRKGGLLKGQLNTNSDALHSRHSDHGSSRKGALQAPISMRSTRSKHSLMQNKGPSTQAGTAAMSEKKRSVWPPSPLDEKDELPLLQKLHPASQYQPAPSRLRPALQKLKGSSRMLRGTPQLTQHAAPDQLADMSADAAGDEQEQQGEILASQRDSSTGKVTAADETTQQQRPETQGNAARQEGKSQEASPEAKVARRRATWDATADLKDSLKLRALFAPLQARRTAEQPTANATIGAFSHSMQSAEAGPSHAAAYGVAAAVQPPQNGKSLNGSGQPGKDSNGQRVGSLQDAVASASVLAEVLAELRAKEAKQAASAGATARSGEELRQGGSGSLAMAALEEASALDAVVGWYRQRQQQLQISEEDGSASSLPAASTPLHQAAHGSVQPPVQPCGEDGHVASFGRSPSLASMSSSQPLSINETYQGLPSQQGIRQPWIGAEADDRAADDDAGVAVSIDGLPESPLPMRIKALRAFAATQASANPDALLHCIDAI